MATQQVRAWTFTGGYPSSLRLSSVTPPSGDGVQPNHVLVKIHAAGLNPVDIQLMNMGMWSIPLSSYNSEKTLCSDFSGTVIAAAPGTGFASGDDVFGTTMKPFAPVGGTMAEIAHISLDNSCIVKKPKELSHVQAAGLGCVWLTAVTCIESIRAAVESSKDKRVVVLGGSSSAGMYCVYLCKQQGWKVLATCSGRNADFVKGMGADQVVDYTKSDVRTEVSAYKPDAILDCVGGVETHGIAKRYVTIVGDKTSRTTMGGPMTYYWTPFLWVRWAMGKMGVWEEYDNVMLELKAAHLEQAKQLPADKIVTDSTFAFEDAPKAYERLNTGRARGKVIVEIAK